MSGIAESPAEFHLGSTLIRTATSSEDILSARPISRAVIAPAYITSTCCSEEFRNRQTLINQTNFTWHVSVLNNALQRDCTQEICQAFAASSRRRAHVRGPDVSTHCARAARNNKGRVPSRASAHYAGARRPLMLGQSQVTPKSPSDGTTVSRQPLPQFKIQRP
jgi:hypothetical protein